MSKFYFLKFGSGSASTNTGLTPTFTIFSYAGITSTAAPGITETPAGSGLYRFTYAPTLTPVVFEADGGAVLAGSDRYIDGTLDPIQAVDQVVGYSSDSYGSTSVDPSTLVGWAKRNQEFEEGNAVFTKSTGIWDIYTRGSSALLAEKTLTNSTTQATKS